MSRVPIGARFVFMVFVALSLLATDGRGQEPPAVQIVISPSSVDFEPAGPFHRARLTVSGPHGVVLERIFLEGRPIVFPGFGSDARALADGIYRYTLLLFPRPDTESGARDEGLLSSGRFRVADGVIAAIEEREQSTDPERRPGEGVPEVDHVVDDDLIVEGSICSSSTDECASGESFSHDGGVAELKLKGEPVSMWFSDSLNDDFGIEVSSDSFMILDEANTTETVVVESGAASDALHVTGTSAVGLGTATPSQKLHLLGSSVDVRLEDSTVGNTWDILASDDLAFESVDDGSGTGAGVVLALQDEADVGTGVVPGVGIFQSEPEAQLHVEAPGGDPRILVRASAGEPAIQLALENDDAAALSLTAGANEEWIVTATDITNTFRISSEGNSGAELTLESDGDLTILGTLTENSSRAAKRDLETIDSRQVFHTLLELPLVEWSYRNDREGARHMGPMAEDFYEAFGLNASPTGISSLDASGVAFAAIQGFHEEIQAKLAERDAEIERFEAELGALRSLVAELLEREELESSSNRSP